MLKNDIRYVIKRVVVAILIAMIIFFLKSNNVLALSWDLEVKQQIYIYNTAPATCSWSTPTNAGQALCRKDFSTSYTNTNGYNFMVIPFTLAYSQWGTSSGESTNSYSSFRAVLRSNTTWSTCEIQNNFLVCPLISGLTYTGVQIYSTSVVDSILYEINLNNAADLYNFRNTMSGTNTILNNILQSQQAVANDQMDNSSVTTSDVDVSQMSGVQGILPAGPVDSLLSLPLTLINLLISGTSGSCTPFTFTFVFDETFTLPCFDTFWSQVPSSMMIFLSDLPAVYIFIKWAKSIYSRVERAVSFESSVDDEWGGV